MRYSTADIKGWLDTAKKSALMAGDLLFKAKGSGRTVIADHGSEIKISADRRSEEAIIDFLRRRSSIPILTEESGMVGCRRKDGLLWIVDPLDGSINYLRGIPISCVSIALWRKHDPILGVIYDFNKNELFTGIAGQGAWLNKKPIFVSKIESKKKSILFTGVPVKADHSAAGFRLLVSNIWQYRKARWIGSAALSIAYVAAGRGDAYFEKGVMLWDVAAGLAIASGAGARYFLKETRANNSYSVFVAGKELYGKG